SQAAEKTRTRVARSIRAPWHIRCSFVSRQRSLVKPEERRNMDTRTMVGSMRGSVALVATIMLLTVDASIARARAEAPAPAATGSYRVAEAPLFTTLPDPADDVIVTDRYRVRVGSCSPVEARFRRRRDGVSVVAAFENCPGLSGRLRLKMKIDPTCHATIGSVSGPGFRKKFTASRVTAAGGLPAPTVSLDPSLVP